MKRILVCGAGGSPATNFVRSLRDASEPYFLVGTDADPFTLQRAETDVRLLLPRADDPRYLSALNAIIQEHQVEFVHAQNDAELEFLSENREHVMAKTWLPSKETVRTCVDKFMSYEAWQASGVPVPKTMLISSEEDLKRAFSEVGPRIWLRNRKGAAGNGAFPTEDFSEALEWLNLHNGWDQFTAATCLTKDTVTWMSLWQGGELVVAQGRKRLSWELGNRAPSGVTGVTGTGVTYGDAILDDIAERAVRAIDPMPDGIFSVDCTYDEDGLPRVTEINIGRFFTTHYFFTKAGLNMPDLYVRLALGEAAPPLENRYNPLPSGLVWVRGVDFEPILTTLEAIEGTKAELDERLKGL